MELIMANGQMGISSYSLLQGFAKTPMNPISRIALQRDKVRKNRIFSGIEAGTGLVDSAKIIEKQFEFEPSFDEYLKAMESVKTGRERGPANFMDNSNVRRQAEVEQGMESNEQGKEYSDKSGLKSTSSGAPKNKSNFASDRVVKGNGTTRDLLHSELEYKQNDGDLSTKWDKVDGRWTNDFPSQSSAMQSATKDQMYRGSYRKTDAFSDVDLGEGGFDEKSKYTNVQKNPLKTYRRIATHVSNTETVTNFTSVNRWVPERKQSWAISNRSSTSESSLARTLDDWETTSNNGSEKELYETKIWKKKSMSQTSEVDRQINDYKFSESKSSYCINKNVTSNRNVPKRETQEIRSSNAHLELGRNYRHSNDRSIKSGNFAKGSKFLEGQDGEGDMEMERAAFKSFEVFTDLRGQPRVLRMEMEERIQNLAKWLNGTDINLPEWLFSKMIHSARIRFSDHSILRVIQILGTLGNWRRVLQVIEWLESRERFKSYKSRYIYTTALDALGKAKRPVEALNVFHAMRKGMSSYPDLAAYHCIAVTLGQAGYVKELFDVIDCMRSPPSTKLNTGFIEKWDPRLEPDIIVYNAVLNACARRKQWEGAFWVLQQLKEQGLQPSSTTYGLVMEVMLACEKYNLVYEFFRKVQKSTIPNSLNYKVLVNTLWKEGKTDDAVFAVKDMEKRGIVGSASLYYDLARCLCSAGRCQEALMQMDNICKVARKPLVVTYTGLIQACLDAGNVQDGTYIFKQMQAFCSPNLVTFNIMLKAYIEHGMFEDAKELFQKMVDESCHITRRSDYKNIVTPDSYTFNTMLDACAAEQKWDDFRYIFQEMLHRGYKFNTRRHLRIILDACRAGKGELLEMTWKHLVQANRVPPPPLIKEMFCMKLENNDYTAAITSITSHPTNDLRLHAFSEKGWLDLLKANTDRFQKDTIIRLTDKLNAIVAGSDRPHPVIHNLISSCREFIETHSTSGEINSSDSRENICVT